jgi:hypothetical protein
MERNPYPITEAVVRQRREAATTHGGQSEYQIRSKARAHRRRLMRQMNLRIGDLDGIALGYLDGWARAQAVVDILGEHFSERGLIDAEGNPLPSLRVYFTGLNSARLALNRLAEHLERHDGGGEALEDYVVERYG